MEAPKVMQPKVLSCINLLFLKLSKNCTKNFLTMSRLVPC